MKDSEGRTRNGPGVSRRQFLKGSGAAAATSALATLPARLPAEYAAEAPPEVTGIGPAAAKITLNVNDKEMTTSVEPRTTLLDTLRNHLDVTGCKRVCDRGTCGACTVMVDGKPIYSCTMFALEAQGKKVKTAEALISGGKLDSVPAAFVKYDAQQCGFCTPGFVVAMRAAFDKNPKATPAEIEEALSGNICRCGTYQQMRDAVQALCGNPPANGDRKGG
jgi:xanthine dehydrogenase YagT iron-sulfur-binding subunit